MSIFGNAPTSSLTDSPTVSREDSKNVDLSAYAKKDYVDQKDNLRVLKRGDTMTGDLNMRRRLVRGLPTDYPPRYSGDEAVSWRQSIGLMNDYFQMALRLDGYSTMRGVLQMGNHNIKDVKDPLQPQDAATKNYVDSRSRGNTITEDLQMEGHRIKLVGDPLDSQDAATKNYVDHRKPLITVWAEKKSTAKRKYEWSFGGNASGADKNIGYPMMAAGRVLRMGLTAITRSRILTTGHSVKLLVNGEYKYPYSVITTTAQSGIRTFDIPLELAVGDILNFESGLTSTMIVAEVASLLIELDL